jgi:predicted DsbA family dithiol-disulfide isomerase
MSNINTFKTVTAAIPKMKVEVWSDIMCPFCYIGKRNYESALKQFGEREQVAIEWHSFQLDPTIPKNSPKKENVYQYLADKKGMSHEQSVKLHESVVETAKKAGLDYRFDRAIVANSFDAHRLIQLAKTKGLGDEAEERLFRAYFTEGKDFGDHDTLVSIGQEIGLTKEDVELALRNEDFAAKVEADIEEASEMGIRGVPFFVFDRKYAVSGAQPPEHFLQALKQSFEEWQTNHPTNELTGVEGAVCMLGGECN